MEQIIRQAKIVPVIRHANVDNVIPALTALLNGGIKVVEITAETPNFANVLETAKNHFQSEIYIGAGTVLDAETARIAILSGADFIVTPTLNKDTITMCNRYGKSIISGAFTPTEILTAFENGSKIVKLFPAGVIGPDYIKNIQGPLPHIPLMVTGGISIEEAESYLALGCVAVGLGSGLVNMSKLQTQADYLALEEKTRTLIQKINK